MIGSPPPVDNPVRMMPAQSLEIGVQEEQTSDFTGFHEARASHDANTGLWMTLWTTLWKSG